MPITQEAVLKIIFQALNGINEELDEEDRVPASVDTVLFGKDSLLDSLAFVSLIVDVETAVSDEMGEAVCLMSDDSLQQKKSPFTDVRTLCEYILQLTGGKD